jgi:tetratricopeptide (TPR) repeat protein
LSSSIIQQLEEIKYNMNRGVYLESIEILEKMIEEENLNLEDKVRIDLLLCEAHFMMVQWRYQIIFPDRYYADIVLKRMKILSKEIHKLNNLELTFQFHILEFMQIFLTAENEQVEDIFKKITNVYEQIKNTNPELEKKKKAVYHIWSGYYSHLISFGGVEVADNYMEISRKHFSTALDFEDQSDDPFMVVFSSYNLLAMFFINEGKLEKAIETLDKIMEKMEEYGNDYAKAFFMGYYASIYEALGNQTNQLEYMIKRKELWDKLEMEGRESAHSINMGYYYSDQGDREKALNFIKKGLEYYEEIDAEVRLSFFYSEIGGIYLDLGDLVEAEDYIHKAYVFLTENKFEYWWNVLPRMARVYHLKGNLEKAKEIYEEALAFQENRQSKVHIISALRNLSIVLWQMGKKEEALEYATRSYEIASKTDSLLWQGYVLSHYIFLLMENDEMADAENKLEDLDNITKKTNDIDLERDHKYSQAIILSKKKTEKDRLKAEIFLEELLKEDLDYHHRVKFLTTLTELLFSQLYESNDKETLNKIKGLVLDLFSMASANQSFLLTAECLLLQSKLALLEMDIEKSKQLQEKANKIAEEKGLVRISNIVEEERARFTDDVEKLQNIEEESTYKEIMDVIGINKRVNGVKKTGISIERTQETEFSTKLMSIKI